MGITAKSTTARRSSAWAGGGVAVVAVLALAGCGSSSSGDSGSPPSSSGAGSSAPATSAAPGSSGGGVTDAAVQTALKTTSQAQSAKLTMQETVKTAGKSVTLDGSGVTTLSGAGSPAGAKGEFTMTAGSQQVQMRQLGTTLYEKVPAGAARTKLSGGKPWIKIDTSKLTASPGSTDEAPDASAELAYLQHGQKATKVGTENVDGAATTHYRTTVPADALSTSGLKASKPMTVDIWVDAQHRVRVEKATLAFSAAGSNASPSASTTQAASIAITMHLKDFGTDVNVSAPPSSQVTDATRKVASAGGDSTAAS